MRCASGPAKPTATRCKLSSSQPATAPGLRSIKSYLAGEYQMGALPGRAAKLAAAINIATIFSFATPAFAGTSDISAADTAWMIVATALVLMMLPGLALFYSGMVRKKNVLATMAQSLAAVAV